MLAGRGIRTLRSPPFAGSKGGHRDKPQASMLGQADREILTGRLRLPPPRGSTSVDKVWEGIAKQLVPEVRHSSDKAQTRAIEAIRRRGMADVDEADKEPHDTIDDGPPVPLRRLFRLGMAI